MLDYTAQAGSAPAQRVAKPKGTWRTYGRLLTYAWRYKTLLIISVLFACVTSLGFMSMILAGGKCADLIYSPDELRVTQEVTGYVVKAPDWVFSLTPLDRDALSESGVALVKSLRQDTVKGMTVVALVLLTLSFLTGLARFFQEYFAGLVGAGITVQLGKEMFENVVRASLGFYEQHASGQLLARFTNDIFMVNRGFAGVFVKIVREPIKAALFLGTALAINVKMTLLVLVVVPTVAYVIIRIGRKVKKYVTRSLQRVAAVASVAGETFRGLEVVIGFCMEDHFAGRVNTELDGLRKQLARSVRASATVTPLTEFLLWCAIALFLMLGAKTVEAGEIKVFPMLMLFAALGATMDPLRKLADINNMIQTSVASAERVFEFIDVKPEIVEREDAKELPKLQDTLVFDNVRFAYNADTEVLRGISVTVKRGEMVALVGPSGAGKSTLANLVPRFYEVTDGRVLIDNTDIRDVTCASLRNQIGIVTQNTVLFDDTVRGNIAFGRADFTDAQVQAAAKAAHAHEFIEKLAQGYDTRIGESGDLLSGGQRQRLAIARALLKDPAILILDEATSSLDSESERAIQQAIDESVVGRTTLVIAHRLSTVQRADRILVIDDGRVIEQGTHNELMAIDGLYQRLYETQFVERTSEQTS